MKNQIRPMVEEDRNGVLDMMRVFYASPAVLSNGSEEIFEFLEKKYPDALLRLEVEEENERAIKVYEKYGYEILPYLEMKK